MEKLNPKQRSLYDFGRKPCKVLYRPQVYDNTILNKLYSEKASKDEGLQASIRWYKERFQFKPTINKNIKIQANRNFEQTEASFGANLKEENSEGSSLFGINNKLAKTSEKRSRLKSPQLRIRSQLQDPARFRQSQGRFASNSRPERAKSCRRRRNQVKTIDVNLLNDSTLNDCVLKSNPKILLSECFDRFNKLKLTRIKRMKKARLHRRHHKKKSMHPPKDFVFRDDPYKPKKKIKKYRKKVFVLNYKHNQYFNFNGSVKDLSRKYKSRSRGRNDGMSPSESSRPWSPQTRVIQHTELL
ncbi:unnamed protein product [Moneuplotes crassus]|uniref:Uncharacterized protein n=1 Tax=Euplotes crassus TaxID=5936 RepID=A0AAD1XL57_EUPCR|nr:unnamed protein product [Moneuplotes crassus]